MFVCSGCFFLFGCGIYIRGDDNLAIELLLALVYTVNPSTTPETMEHSMFIAEFSRSK
jgi:hypothetical protein